MLIEFAIAPKPAEREPLQLRVKLERTQCFGTCPAYTVVLYGSGRVEWMGHASVDALGKREAHVSRATMEELSHQLDRARFFERDEYGELPRKQECTTVGGTTQCSFATSFTLCSDTSHAIISVSRNGRVHKVDNDHCSDRPELEALEGYIDQIANTEAWIQP
jgi:hypothetical protein